MCFSSPVLSFISFLLCFVCGYVRNSKKSFIEIIRSFIDALINQLFGPVLDFNLSIPVFMVSIITDLRFALPCYH
ncbi:hypothetical protein CAEBREN_02430 [Caenorhabditis brenneri]|uniref:Uncharacterized protein n=1 Tax=Caenorhabditis brenneri TaxID=135651 RepID=G0MKY8_CAEBE|nr:hypothetical protein CAEBREN_02430 [Caenorhabditis brenneri]